MELPDHRARTMDAPDCTPRIGESVTEVLTADSCRCVVTHPGAGDIFSGSREHDRRASRRPRESEARNGAKRRTPGTPTGREARPEGFSQHIRPTGGIEPGRPRFSGTCLLRHIPGSVRVLTGARESDAVISGVRG